VRRVPRVVGAAAAILTLAATVTACAQIPTAGPVQRGDQVQGADDDPPVRVLARGPVAGQSAAAVVKGFLDASASFEDDHAVARRFLTPRADAAWNADAGVTVIDDVPRRTFETQGNQVILGARQTARISADGAYVPLGDVDFTQTFPMRKVDGEWRIAQAPQGLILDRIEVSLAFRAFNIYFMNPEHTFLVADPVYLPVEPTGTATALIQTLLNGPTRWLRPAVVSMVPAGTKLVVESVPVENGIAKVDLSADFLDAGPEALEQAAAQITTTLLELSSSVSGVSVSVEGSPLQLPTQPAVFSANTWDRYEPDSLKPALGAVFTQGDVVQRLDGGERTRAPGALGSGRYEVQQPSQSWDGSTLTALSLDSTQLLVTHPLVNADVSRVLRGRHLLPATIDGQGRLWLLDVGGPEPRLRVFQGGRWRSAVLQAPPGHIRSFRVSADGTRVAIVLQRHSAATSGGQLLVGRVVRGADHLRVEAFRRVELTLTKVRNASWVDATSLAVIGTSSGAAVEPLLVNINRTVTPLSNDVLGGATSVVGAPGLPMLADTPSDGLYQSSGTGWRFLMHGHDPAYPG
jgi:hypothetical protein